jgi:hypothetical protein
MITIFATGKCLSASMSLSKASLLPKLEEEQQ